MKGLMMEAQLLISSIAQHAERFHGDREIVSVTVDNPRHRYTIREAMTRARCFAKALARLGVVSGDRVASLAWNDYRHLEVYYAVSGSGYVCHTINPRLFPEQIVYIINHAEDRFICVDAMFVPLLEAIADKIPNVEGFIVMTDEAHMPDTSLSNVICYETLIAAETPEFDWPQFDERTASALCYTSGTTGNPKGVLYDHRSTILHAWGTLAIDVAGMSSRDVVLPVVPFFHVNAWGVPYSALMAGAKLVLPGPKMGDGEALYELMDSEDVTMALGVPTVWLALLQYTEKAGKRLDKLQRSLVGGAAVPIVGTARPADRASNGSSWRIFMGSSPCCGRGRPARWPCVPYSETGSNTPAPTKLHGPVWPPHRRSNSTVLVWPEHTSAGLWQPEPRHMRAMAFMCRIISEKMS